MAYNDKEHDYKKLERSIVERSIDKEKVILLYGHEDYLVKSYERKLREIYVDPVAAELDYVLLEGENISVDEIIAHGDTLPMLSGKRVVTIRNYPALEPAARGTEPDKTGNDFFKEEEIKRLAGYLEDIPDTTLFIFLGERVDVRKTIYKKISQMGSCYNFKKLDRKDLISFIKKRFRAESKYADDSVVREIINTTGYFDRDSDYTLNGIAGDIVKISSFSDSDEIKQADVSSVLSTSLETDAFALLDSLNKGNKNEALLLVDNIMETGENGFKLLGLIISQFELMLGIKEYSMRNLGKSEIMNEMGIKSEFRYRKVYGYTNRYSVEKLNNILKKLFEVEKNIKTGIYGEKLAMTMFIAEV